MDYSKRVVASLLIFQAFFTQVKGSCHLQRWKDTKHVVCEGPDILNLMLALSAVEGIEDATTLKVQRTPLVKIEANVTTKAFKNIILLNNEKLENIHPSAFAASSATNLVIEGSPQLGKSVWAFVSRMTATEVLALNRVGLTEVPADAFSALKRLRKINLLNNGMTTFSVSLAELNLEELGLSNNKITQGSFSENVFKGEVHIGTLCLMNNLNLTRLEKSQFEGLLNNGTKVFVGNNEITYMKCAAADWLCVKEEGAYLYADRLFGYWCSDSHIPMTIFQYCKLMPSK